MNFKVNVPKIYKALIKHVQSKEDMRIRHTCFTFEAWNLCHSLMKEMFSLGSSKSIPTQTHKYYNICSQAGTKIRYGLYKFHSCTACCSRLWVLNEKKNSACEETHHHSPFVMVCIRLNVRS